LKEQNENIISYRNKLKKYLELFNNCKKLLFLTGTPVKKNVEDIRWFINLSAGKMVVPYVMQDFNVKYIKQNKLYENIEKIAIPFLELFNININIPDDYNSSGIEKYRSNIMMIVDEILSNNRIPQNPIINKVIKKMLGNSIINTIKLYIEKYMTDELNISQIDWGNYISYYKYDNLDYYPKALPKIRSVDYTDYQYDVWYKGNNNKLTDEESVILMFNENQEDARLFKPYTKEDINKKQGTIIGNMTSKDQYPSKFIKIIQDYEENKLNGKFLRTLVYSNYYESGIKLFAAYLDEKEIEYKIYDKPLKTWTQEQIKDNNKNMLDFENGELTLLLLHPAYFEGFSIRKVRRFHILEPIDSYYMKEQLYTRVVRYKSHTDLPIEERNVTIIQWYCTFKNLTGYINKNLILGKNLEFKFNDLEFEGSPDDILMKKVNSHETMLNDVSKALKEKSIENSVELIDTCCIFNEKCDSKLQKCEALEGGKNKQSIEFF
jgi:hypothetical protein